MEQIMNIISLAAIIQSESETVLAGDIVVVPGLRCLV